MPNPDSAPSPLLFIQAASAYERTAALSAAVELDIFTHAAADGSAAAIAKACGASERGVRILCDFLTIEGFLTKTDGRYGVTADTAAFLVRSSPMYLGGMLRFLHSPMVKGAFNNLTEAVRRGGTALEGEGTVSKANPVWVDFAVCMQPFAMPVAHAVAEAVTVDAGRPYRVLDIAAGHGLYGIMIAKRHANAQIVALDWPEVVAVAADNARKMGVGARHSTIAGSAFDADFGGKYDLVLLTNFLHHFDTATCETMLKKVRASLNPGGAAVTVEFVPNDDRVSPPDSAGFSLVMLATTRDGDAYTFAELSSMFRNAGFSRSEMHAAKAGASSIIISHA